MLIRPIVFLLVFLVSTSAAIKGQVSLQTNDPIKLPSFEVATIKPSDPSRGGVMGFVGSPGGRVHVGFATIETLIYYAFNIPSDQIFGIPPQLAISQFEIAAVPPLDAKSRTEEGPPVQATPTAKQRDMLQSLLIDRFGLEYHPETKQGPVYLLLRGKGKLQLEDAKDKTLDQRGAVMSKGGIIDGEAFGTNINMKFLADMITRNMGRPVLDRTGLSGSYDFHLDANDPENTDALAATIAAVHRLGLELKASKGPIEAIVVDSVHAPSEN